MKRMLFVVAFVTLAARAASAEFRHIDLAIFGMD